MTIKEIREMTGLSQKAFAIKYGIPKRTIENWESKSNNHRECPDYVVNLLKQAIDCEDVLYMKNIKALSKLYYAIDRELSISTIYQDYKNGYLSEISARNNREVLWYMDDINEKAIYTDTLEFLSDEEIEEELS